MFAFLSSSKLKENLTELHIIVRTTSLYVLSDIFFGIIECSITYYLNKIVDSLQIKQVVVGYVHTDAEVQTSVPVD